MSTQLIDSLKNLSINKIKQKVKDIKSNLPLEERSTITYSKNFTLSLSNYCQNMCGYCYYNYKIPKINDEANVILLENEQIQTLTTTALKYNCKEALIMSGEYPDIFKEVRSELKKRRYNRYIDFVVDICKYLLNFNILPHTNIGILTYSDLEKLKNYNASMGLMLESTNKLLFEKGGVHEKSPGKDPKKRIQHIQDAGKLNIPFTTGLLLGIGENIVDRIRDLLLIRKIHEDYGHIQEVIIQNFVAKEGITYKPKNMVSIEETLRTAGIAKIVFENEIAVQLPPNLIKGYEREALNFGVDDFGGISPFSIDYINPNNTWPQIDHLTHICNKEGYLLKERLPIYHKFINNNKFCPKNIKKRIDKIKL
ncbi:MAG: 7,8-didemethyl-8-hydroxy-5-deazariboflavin synthase subunit CofG [Promethearchaeota archaeon]